MDATALLAIQTRAEAATGAVRLPLRNRRWRGTHGNWAGVGSGSSIDFHDHRTYLPGDDPRYLDWQAYARSSHYIMKLYREETTPAIDLALDLSASMRFDPAKETRTFELFHFALASALQSCSAVRLFLLAGGPPHPLPTSAALSPETLLAEMAKIAGKAETATACPALEQIPWRAGALRVWISDLLYPGAPALLPLAAGKGRGVVLAPWCRAEQAPAWEGNLDFVDCETGRQRPQRVDAALLARYHDAYDRHFGLWRAEAARHGVALARVDSDTDLLTALRGEALPCGAIEMA